MNFNKIMQLKAPSTELCIGDMINISTVLHKTISIQKLLPDSEINRALILAMDTTLKKIVNAMTDTISENEMSFILDVMEGKQSPTEQATEKKEGMISIRQILKDNDTKTIN